MNKYEILVNTYQKEFSKYMRTFSNHKEYEEIMRCWGLKPNKDRDKITFIDKNNICLTKNKPLVDKVITELRTKTAEGFASDTTGMGFIYDTFAYCLNCQDRIGIISGILTVLGYSEDALDNDPKISTAFNTAVKNWMEELSNSPILLVG